MQMQIRKAMENESDKQLFTGIVEADECYIGGKPKKSDKKKDDDDLPRGRGTKKQGVIGAVEHESGKVVAKTQNTFTFVEMKAFLEKHVNFEKATLYTDDFTGYKPFKKITKHSTVNHSFGEYVSEGSVHTNTIEGFWGIFKRSIVGSYHKLSIKHLDKYITECCFKYNNRNNENMFDLLVRNGVC
jgi:transposase